MDRGWDAYWVLSQPLYVVVRMIDALGVAAQKESPKKRNADGAGSTTYKVDPAARKARQAARAAKLKEQNE